MGASSTPRAIDHEMALRGQGLGLDSLDVVALIVQLEEEFEVSFEDEEMAASVKTFGALLAALERKLGAAAPRPSGPHG